MVSLRLAHRNRCADAAGAKKKCFCYFNRIPPQAARLPNTVQKMRFQARPLPAARPVSTASAAHTGGSRWSGFGGFSADGEDAQGAVGALGAAGGAGGLCGSGHRTLKLFELVIALLTTVFVDRQIKLLGIVCEGIIAETADAGAGLGLEGWGKVRQSIGRGHRIHRHPGPHDICAED